MSPTDFPKPYRLALEHHEKYLYAMVEGDQDTYEISRQYWQEIADECNASGCTHLLVYEDIPEAVSPADVYHLVIDLASMGLIGVKVAFVDKYTEQQELNEFGVLVGTNRGMNAKAFNDLDEARSWLLSDV